MEEIDIALKVLSQQIKNHAISNEQTVLMIVEIRKMVRREIIGGK